MVQICDIAVKDVENSETQQIIKARADREAAHMDSGPRLTPDEHLANFSLEVDPKKIDTDLFLIVDDVITTGSTFVACSMFLTQVFPNVDIVGIFIARRVIASEEDALNSTI